MAGATSKVTRLPQKPNGVRAEVVKVTPKLAEDWLGKNSHNRPLRNGVVETLAGAMSRGEWVLNGDAIRWSGDGSMLLDGQHRLWAVVESGTTIESLVVWGIKAEAQDTMDMGARRNLKDVLALRGVKNAAQMAAALNVLWRRREGLIRVIGAKPTVAQALALLAENPGLAESVQTTQRVASRFHMSLSITSVAHYEFAALDPEACDVFFEKLTKGVGLNEGEPILALRRWLERQSVAGAGARANQVVTMAMLIKGWNAWREGRHVEQLNWKVAGLKAEAFPEPR